MSFSRSKALAFAVGLAAIWSSPSAAQVPRVSQTPATSRPMSSEPPTGTATRTTDKQGQTNEPRGITGTKQPPSGKLNLDRIPVERRGDAGTAHQLTTPRDAASSGGSNASASHHTKTSAKAAIKSSAKTTRSSAKRTAKKVRKASKKHHPSQPQPR